MYTYYYTTRWNFYNTKSQQYNTHLSDLIVWALRRRAIIPTYVFRCMILVFVIDNVIISYYIMCIFFNHVGSDWKPQYTYSPGKQNKKFQNSINHFLKEFSGFSCDFAFVVTYIIATRVLMNEYYDCNNANVHQTK